MPISLLSSSASPFDEAIERATSENQTAENWALILDICDAVKAGGSKAAKSCLLSLKKRLNHRDPHVILYTLTVLDGCISNCGALFISEVCSREFIAELRSKATGSQRQVADRTRDLIKKWSNTECKSDPGLRNIPFLYNELKSEGYDFSSGGSGSAAASTKKTASVDEVKETDDLAKAILLSLKEEQHKQKGSSGPLYPTQAAATAGASAADSSSKTTAIEKSHGSAKALYDFEAAEENELTFNAGEMITVTDDSDPNWWRGFNTRGEGLFPSSFVTYDLSVTVPTTTSATGAAASKKKGVQFDDHVDVKVIEQQPQPAPLVIDQQKLDHCLELLQNADPTGERPDPPELLELEEQCLAMAPLIETEIEALDKQSNLLSEVNTKLVDAFHLYHAAMNEASEQLRAQAAMPYPNQYVAGTQTAPAVQQLPVQQQQQQMPGPAQMYATGYVPQ